MTITDQAMQLAEAIDKARTGDDLMIRCPAHEDGTASLHVTPSAQHDGGVVLRCFADCEPKAVLDAVNLTWSDLFGEQDQDTSVSGVWTPQGDASNIYPYRDAQGNLLYEVLRVPQGGRKTFFQRRPDPDNPSGYVWRLEGVERVLYRLPQVIEAVRAGRTIYVPEGEKDVGTLVLLGLDATTNAGGAGKWQDSYSETLAGAEVVILSDSDNTGRAHARKMRESLIEHGCRVEIRESPPPHKDVTALVDAGRAITDMIVVVPFDQEARPKFGVDLLDIIVREHTPRQYVMPHVLAHRERLLITGFEGHGKSTLMRQMAVQAAAGISWFSNRRCEPVRVLSIDAENEPDQALDDWQHLHELSKFHGDGIERNMLTVLEEWESEIDLIDPEWTAWLHERIYGYRPDLCFLGPLTNLVGRDLREDEPVRKLKNAINSARSICGTAFVMEHHAPHKSPSDKARSVRPYGSSMFLKWPDYGFGLLPDQDERGLYHWQRTRWPRVRNRAWPDALRWGEAQSGEWMWTEAQPQ